MKTIRQAFLSTLLVVIFNVVGLAEEGIELRLPSGVGLYSMRVTPDETTVMVISIPGSTPNRRVMVGWKTGEVRDLFDIAGENQPDTIKYDDASISMNGGLVAFTGVRPDYPRDKSLFIGNLKSRGVRNERRAANFAFAWFGEQLAYALIDDHDDVYPIQIWDEKQPTRTLNIRGLPVGESRKGDLLFICMNPDKPSAGIKRVDLIQKGRVVAVNSQGTVVIDLGPASKFLNMPIQSPNGNYIAWREDSEGSSVIKVKEGAAGMTKVVKGPSADILAVTDDGQVVLKKISARERFVIASGVGGTSTLLPSGFVDAAVSGQTLYYFKPRSNTLYKMQIPQSKGKL